MPQASSEIRAKMLEFFGDEISETGPCQFLEKQGYRLTKGWLWAPKPGVRTYGDMEEKEYLCLLFLCHEWDFGGLAYASHGTEEKK